MQRERDVEDRGQGPLAAAHELGEVERAAGQELVEVVPATRRITLGVRAADLGRVLVDDAVDGAVDVALDAARAALALELHAAHGARSSATLPSASRTSCAITWSTVLPYLIERVPALSFATMPPMARAVAGADVRRELQAERREARR